MKLSFVYLSPFVADARRLGFIDEDLQDLESMLLDRPDAGATSPEPVASGKFAFPPPDGSEEKAVQPASFTPTCQLLNRFTWSSHTAKTSKQT